MPSQENSSIDETMVGFSGCFDPKQYMPKSIGSRLLHWQMLARDTWNVLLYSGTNTLASASAMYNSFPQPARVVGPFGGEQKATHLHRQLLQQYSSSYYP